MPINLLPRCCTDFEIDPIDLLFPQRMGPEGRAFVEAHGVDKLTLPQIRKMLEGAPRNDKGWFRVEHRCNQLNDDGTCKIYETRPQICRTFSCATRSDCTFCRGGECEDDEPEIV